MEPVFEFHIYEFLTNKYGLSEKKIFWCKNNIFPYKTPHVSALKGRHQARKKRKGSQYKYLTPTETKSGKCNSEFLSVAMSPSPVALSQPQYARYFF